MYERAKIRAIAIATGHAMSDSRTGRTYIPLGCTQHPLDNPDIITIQNSLILSCQICKH
jgi:hypothetical protein